MKREREMKMKRDRDEERERKRERKIGRFTVGKTKANEFGESEVETHESGDAQPVECKEEPSARFEQSRQSGECRKTTRRCSWHQETDAEPKPRSNRIFLNEATGKTFKMETPGNRRQG